MNKQPSTDKTDFINMSGDVISGHKWFIFHQECLTLLNALLIFRQRTKSIEHYRKGSRIDGLIQLISVVVSFIAKTFIQEHVLC